MAVRSGTGLSPGHTERDALSVPALMAARRRWHRYSGGTGKVTVSAMRACRDGAGAVLCAPPPFPGFPVPSPAGDLPERGLRGAQTRPLGLPAG